MKNRLWRGLQAIWLPPGQRRKGITLSKAEGFYYHIVKEQMASVNNTKGLRALEKEAGLGEAVE